MDSNSLLDALKARLNVPSDYALARDVLKMHPNSIRTLRERGLSDERAIQIADLLGYKREEVLAHIHFERARSPEVKAVWERMVSMLRDWKHTAAAFFIVAICTMGVPPKVAEAAGKISQFMTSPAIHYARLRRWLAAVAALFALSVTPANAAVDLELGAARYAATGDGVWFQQDFPHQLDLTDKSYSIALRGAVAPWLDWRFGFADLGRVHTDALAVPEDANYDFVNHTCNGPCMPLSRFIGHGGARGFFLTLQPTYRRGKFYAFAEGGVTLMRVQWSMYIQHDPTYVYPLYPNASQDGTTAGECRVCAVDAWGFGRRLGVGIGYGNVSLTYSRFDKLSVPGDDPANGVPVFNAAHLLALRVAF